MKAWLKGGLIGGVISIILNLIQIILVFSGFKGLTIIAILLSPAYVFLTLMTSHISIAIASLLISFIIYFIAGSFIGWIVGKIK